MTEHGERIRADYYVQQSMTHVIALCGDASAVSLGTSVLTTRAPGMTMRRAPCGVYSTAGDG